MIIISPYSQKLPNGKTNPKNYPFWKELIPLIDDHIVQVGVHGEERLVPDFRENLSIQALCELLHECRTWISCDSFLQHLGWHEGVRGIVLWSVSDPLIFGHPENLNLLKSRDYLVSNQFLTWDHTEHKSERFVAPEVVAKHLLEF